MPVLYLLHGLGGDDQQWLALGLAETADQLMESEAIPPLLIVLPWQRTGLEDEKAIIEGLLPHIEDEYRIQTASSGRAIGGLSRGGGWAFRLGLKYSDRFSQIGLHSPALLSGDLTSMELWLADEAESDIPRIWMDIGDQDSLLSAAREIEERFMELDVDYEFSIRPGDHLAIYWESNLREYLIWYSKGW
jgi:enterochelin esterase-like enzyme